MRILTLSGRVVSDAVVRQMKDGRNYLEFRFANNEWFDEKDKTFWIRVACYSSELINLKQYITKGKPLNLVGRYKDRIYVRQDGVPEIGRDLTAYSIEFPETNKKEESEQQTQTQAAAPANPVVNPQVQATPTAAATQAPKPVQSAPAVADSEDDDLPF